jgi:hypothetical protein
MNDKELQLVTFEQAKRLKSAGFDWHTNHFYGYLGYDYCLADNYQDWNSRKWDFDERISAPAVALALQWMRNVKNIHYEVGVNQYCYEPSLGSPFNARYDYRYTFKAYKDGEKVASRGNAFQIQDAPYKSHESAEIALLNELLTILENGK